MLHAIPKFPDNRPLLRWTAGRCSKVGIEILVEAIKSARRIYPEFNFAVCYNNLPERHLSLIRGTGVRMVDQQCYISELTYPPVGALWALYPTRLNFDGFELYSDNDIVLTGRLPVVDQWLKSNGVLWSKSAAGARNYGVYTDLVAEKYHLNSGFFGLPPRFDFRRKINELYAMRPPKPRNHVNFQGVVAAILLSQPLEQFVVTKKDLQICRPQYTDMRRWAGVYGTHFLAANRVEVHGGWDVFKKERLGL